MTMNKYRGKIIKEAYCKSDSEVSFNDMIVTVKFRV